MKRKVMACLIALAVLCGLFPALQPAAGAVLEQVKLYTVSSQYGLEITEPVLEESPDGSGVFTANTAFASSAAGKEIRVAVAFYTADAQLADCWLASHTLTAGGTIRVAGTVPAYDKVGVYFFEKDSLVPIRPAVLRLLENQVTGGDTDETLIRQLENRLQAQEQALAGLQEDLEEWADDLSVDATLTKAGRPADAKAVGDLFETINAILSDLSSSKPDDPESTKSTLIHGWGNLESTSGYIALDGTVIPHTGFVSSDLIPALPGTEIEYALRAITATSYVIAVYDDEETLISEASLTARKEGVSGGIGVDLEGTLLLPENAAYFRVMDSAAKSGTFSYYTMVKESEPEEPEEDPEEIVPDRDTGSETTTTLAGGWGKLKTVSGYLDTNGKIVEHDSYVTSEYIPVIQGKEIEYHVQSITNVCCILAVYDDEKNFISDLSIKPTEETGGLRKYFSGTYKFPDEAAYFRIMDFHTKNGTFSYYKEIRTDEVTPWSGKKWIAFGTSITDTAYINQETGTPTGTYVPYLAEMSGLVVENHGIAGGTIGKGGTYGGSANILDKILTTDLSDADLITIEGFVNDFACSVPIGELGDTGGTEPIADTDQISIYGALYRAVKHCLETAPNATVILLTESTGKIYTLKNGQTANYCFDRKKETGLFQKDYNDAILETGRFMGVRVIDAGSKSQINCFNPEYIVDQIHHTDLGGKQYATVIWDELKHISPKVTE